MPRAPWQDYFDRLIHQVLFAGRKRTSQVASYRFGRSDYRGSAPILTVFEGFRRSNAFEGAYDAPAVGCGPSDSQRIEAIHESFVVFAGEQVYRPDISRRISQRQYSPLRFIDLDRFVNLIASLPPAWEQSSHLWIRGRWVPRITRGL